MKKIDIDTWNRKKTYLWFSSFSNPTYSLSAKIDITELMRVKAKYNRSFYEDMLYLTIKGLNDIPALRQRVVGGEIVEYDVIDPSYTVALKDGLFDICRTKWNDNPTEFCSAVRRDIEKAVLAGGNKEFGDKNVDVYYFTCLPWINFETMTNPIPDDVETLSIPRICWGKYVMSGGRYYLSLSIQVNHALVDGRPLCDAFSEIQDRINNCEELLNLKKI